MVQTLEAIKGGGGSIRVGTTGTISSLMTRELDSIKSAPQMPLSPELNHVQYLFAIPCGATTSKRVYTRNTHRIPCLVRDSIALDRTLSRKTEKKGSNIVEIVDINCGNQDRAWANPISITNRLKKLGFSKLSESIM
ncbi:LOW QUALITY PROTEIN: uncharacterized protein LOC111998887 [Quercus suber]|uniref:LOW QUALITY PROTEIN: uncharacterized protein LOC111998887 n=1 Tax=Quercus suber TaxID=58331 RepID=UPI0032DF623F